MRLAFGALLLAIIFALGICAQIARRSGKRIGSAAAGLLMPIMMPVTGNLIIVLSAGRTLSMAGCYLYYLGLDVTIAALLYFSHLYYRIDSSRKWFRIMASILLAVDAVQLLLNPFFHHAFELTEIEVDGFPYWQMVPRWGQHFHRAVDYLILAGIIVGFIIRIRRAPKLQRERYTVVLLALILVSVWETAYIISGAPLDRSMIGIGVLGLLIFYFSLYYRPRRLLDRMLGNVVSERKNPIFCFDEGNQCIWMNRAGAQFLGLEENELDKAGAELAGLFSGLYPGRTEWQDTVTMTSGGETRRMELTKQPLYDAGGKMDGFYFIMRDLTEEQRIAEQKLYNARHDRLTGVYNRDYLYERTREILDANPGEPFLIISAEVSDLKVINDLYGNAFVDRALQFCASWLRSYQPLTRSVFGRLGGDSFGVCIPEKDFSLERMEKSLSTLTVTEGETRHRMLIHAGIYRITERDLDVSLMYDRAVFALEGIKDDYHYHTAWYEPSMREQVMRNRQISEELGAALEKGQIVPWLQPIVDRAGKIIGAEVLVRWIHPEEGIRSPISFIPMFEKNGMIADVDRYMWRKACEILARWKKEGKDLFLSVNISPRDFYLMDVSEELKRLVREYGVAPAKLRLEIVESTLIENSEERMNILNSLHEAGFCLEMDDFGSGYSSLNLLREMPVDILKIDMMFLRQETARANAIVRQIIAMTRELGVVSLPEGVETRQQYDNLMEMGCQLYQGYWFAKPMPEADFERFIAAGKAGTPGQ